MSDSSIALKPVIDEPSKPIPSSSAASISLRSDREALQVPLEVGEPEEHVRDLLLLDLLQHLLARLRVGRRPVLALDHRHAVVLLRCENTKRPRGSRRRSRARGRVASKTAGVYTTRRTDRHPRQRRNARCGRGRRRGSERYVDAPRPQFAGCVPNELHAEDRRCVPRARTFASSPPESPKHGGARARRRVGFAASCSGTRRASRRSGRSRSRSARASGSRRGSAT